jgi:hypothetical protein
MDANSWRTTCQQYIDLNVWVFYKYCTCGGTPKFKYKNKQLQLELWVMPLRGKFSVFKNGPSVINGAPLNEMRERLEGLG